MRAAIMRETALRLKSWKRIQAFSKINAAGQSIDRSELVSMNDLFDRMINQKLESYAQTGALPEWFKARAE